ncbi:AcvB/VirJ family lysyl-phosphatidylglycerol hydrolase [Pedobacter frigidisoli]|uniref:AcvB/VirJ family lysyl-phosphatidylglycerol hydrolase n=1 Tax=Pedobacter frigidisoli TaxID=2530455 RepID=UPI00292EC11A|nr:AcvB/VirJ family lysyl-phosphatidylglycerol hydrolase [Pedobacter frigidisoli]
MHYKFTFIIALMFICLKGMTQDVSKLPLTAKAKSTAKQVIFYLSGDGGMNSFSQSLTTSLNDKNYAVVSLDSRKYFWEQKSPEKLTQDLSAAVEYYLKAWDKDEFAIIGYSFGADAALFLSHRLSKDLQVKLKATILLSPSTSTDLVIKLTDMMGFGNKEAKYKLVPEISKVTSPLLFIFGKDEESDLYKLIPEKKNITKTQIPGSHKFDNDIKKVVATIQTAL